MRPWPLAPRASPISKSWARIELAAAFPRNVVQVFVTVPGDSVSEQLALLRRRMQERADRITDIEQRLERARALELPYRTRCDYIVVNDDLGQAIEATAAIVRRELRSAASAGRNVVNELSQYHETLGARLAPDHIPLDYGDLALEYAAAKSGAILLDRSHEGRIC